MPTNSRSGYRGRSRLIVLAAAVSAAAGVLLIWVGVLAAGWVSPAVLAYPREVLHALPGFLAPSENGPDLGSTAWRSLLAFLLSVPIGVVVGVASFYSGPYRQPARFGVDFLRSIPATALVPVFLILYGPGDLGRVAVGAFSSALVICLATITGLANRNATRVAVAELMGITGLRRVLIVDLPEALPQITLGLRAGVSLALILVVVSEMLVGSNRGIGRVIADMQYTDDKGRMYAAIFVVGALGYSYNVVLTVVESNFAWWRGNR